MEEPRTAEPVIATFEGDVVSAMEGKLAPVTFEMPEGYARGTILRMEVEVRVKNVRYEEGRRGDLTRQHILALESIALKAAYQPGEEDDTVGGSASARPEQTPEQADEIGLEIGRTSELWGREWEPQPSDGPEYAADHQAWTEAWKDAIASSGAVVQHIIIEDETVGF